MRDAADFYATPPEVGEAMVDAVSQREPLVIADFAAGLGDLLEKAANRFPNAELRATDISTCATRQLRDRGWVVGVVDFLNSRSRAASPVLRRSLQRVDLILLNPPFSCRGHRRVRIKRGGEFFYCGPAVAFLVNSLRYMRESGELVAVLPAGCIGSERDQQVWGSLRRHFLVKLVRENSVRTFKGTAARTVVVHISRLEGEHGDVPLPAKPSSGDLMDRIVRGRLQVHRAKLLQTSGPDRLPFVHSTSLRENRVASTAFVSRNGTSVRGPLILLPRVGAPRGDKMAVLLSEEEVVLSDCVLGIRTGSDQQAEAGIAQLRARWEDLEGLYLGTGAPYITCSRLLEILPMVDGRGGVS